VHQFAQINVTQKKEETAEKMTLKRRASGVDLPLSQTSILDQDFVDYLVLLNSVTVKGKVVYNLTVEDEHEYFANGILVSNSDATLYAWRKAYHYIYAEPEKKLDIDTPEYMEEFEAQEAQKLLDEKDDVNGWFDQ